MSASGYDILVITSAKKKSLNPTVPNGDTTILKKVSISFNLAILNRTGQQGYKHMTRKKLIKISAITTLASLSGEELHASVMKLATNPMLHMKSNIIAARHS